MVDFACLYERFDPTVALDADDPAYVDWQAELGADPRLGLADVKRQLANSVVLTRHGYAHRLVTGLRGGGKTTELRRLQRELEARPEGERYFVSFLDADGTIDLADADPTDLVLAIVRQLVTDLRARDVPVKAGGKMREFLRAAGEVLHRIPDAGVELSVTDPLSIVALSTTLQRHPGIRRQVRELLEGRLPTLYDAINDELLPEVRSELDKRGYAGILAIVDQLDRISAAGDRHRAVFLDGSGKLKALNCHVLYTAPIEYAYSRACPALEGLYGDILGLPLIPVGAEDEHVRRRALALTRRIAIERIERCGSSVDELFEDAALLDDIVALSGGHVRTLFLVVRTAIERSGLVAPLTRAHMAGVVAGLAAKYLDPLEASERELALEVHRTKDKPADEALLPRFHGLLRDQYVFNYWVGDRRWYDWNPLLGRSRLAEDEP